MAKGGKSKLRILMLREILEENTDDQHRLTMTQIIELLKAEGIEVERKSIYDDIEVLSEIGMDVEKFPGKPMAYALTNRGFSIDELMLLVDAVQSCRSITQRQANRLKANIMSLASKYQQEQLERRIHVAGRIKQESSSVFPAIDVIHDALRKNAKVSFGYRRLNESGQPRYGKRKVTPLQISYDDGFYYLSALTEDGVSKEYRLDRMKNIEVVEGEPAQPVEPPKKQKAKDAAMFGHFKGIEVEARLTVEPQKKEILTDRFGRDCKFARTADGRLEVSVPIMKSPAFFGWIAGLDGLVRLTGPDSLVDEYRAYLKKLLEQV